MKFLKSFEEWCLEEKEYELLKQYNLGNNALPANQIGRSASKEVNFYCNVCNLTWKKVLNSIKILSKTKCPFCAHEKVSYFYNLEVVYPKIAKYWDYKKNEKSPKEYLPNSSDKVYWRCEICGNEWREKIKDRVNSYKRVKKERNSYCPYCEHERVWSQYNLQTEYPEIAKQWNYEKNGSLNPINVFPKSQQKVYWKCDFNANHIWKDSVANRTVLHRTCKKCSKEFKMSYPAKVIYYYLRQVFPDCICEVKCKKFVIDIVIPNHKIAIEHDGEYIHGNEKTIKRDEIKDKVLIEEGYNIIRIKEITGKNKKIERKENKIYYPFSYQYTYLNDMIEELFSYLNEILEVNYKINPNHKKDNAKIEQLYFHEKKRRTLAVQRPDIAIEWSNNNVEKPDTVSCYNSKEVLWVCSKCHLEYSASINNRTKNNSGCPFCADKKANLETCLETRYPEIAKQWNYEKNGDLTPRNVLPGSEKKVFWKCEKGHIWLKAIYLRTVAKDKSCPICKMDRNSLKAKYPKLVSWWDYEKNYPLLPENISFASNKNVWWHCRNNHFFEYEVNRLIRKKEKNWCSECKKERVKNKKDKVKIKKIKNRLIDRIPIIKYMLDEEKFKGSIEEISQYSKQVIYLKCENGHKWSDIVRNISRRNYLCPYCSNKKGMYSLESDYPQLLADGDYEKNILNPKNYSGHSNARVHWKCKECGHKWEATIYSRACGSGCIMCYRNLKNGKNI